jgi:Uma2 family endonuclease
MRALSMHWLSSFATRRGWSWNRSLDTAPPPDIAVEIDTTSNSLKKLSIYAALSVPEVWRYDGQNVQIYGLKNGKYVKIPSSHILPRLTGAMLSEFIEMMKTKGNTAARHAFRRRITAM